MSKTRKRKPLTQEQILKRQKNFLKEKFIIYLLALDSNIFLLMIMK